MGKIADAVSSLTRRLVGPELNRTEGNVVAAGLHLQQVRSRGIWREIVATKQPTATRR